MGEIGGWLGVGVGVLIAAGSFIVAWLNNGTRLLKRIDELTTHIFNLQDESRSLQDKHHACERENRELKEEIRTLVYRISHIEQGIGIGPGEPRSGIIVADLTGTIRVYSPTLTPLLRWLPDEVVGKPITKLVPPEHLMHHNFAFKNFVDDERRTTDSSKVILTTALTKTGSRVKVAITLDGWQVGLEGLITATIREITRDPEATSK